MEGSSRRSFLKKTVLGGIAVVSIPGIVSEVIAENNISKIRPGKDFTILFQGDSITDAGRKRDDDSYNNPAILGSGYAMLAAGELLEKFAPLNLKIYNRGISGNKVFQLADRWDKDCLEIKPDILSILIGVNDFWHKLDGNYDGTIEKFRTDYVALLERTKKALPDVKLIICEPFAVPGVKAVDAKWFPDFYEYQKAAKEIAWKSGATFVPFQKVFDKAITRAPGSYWTGDGVHATLAGAQLMASAWMEAIK